MFPRFVVLAGLLSLLACGGGDASADAGPEGPTPDGGSATPDGGAASPDGGSTSDAGTQPTDWIDRTGLSCNSGALPVAGGPDLAVDLLNGGSSYDSTTGDLTVDFSYWNGGQGAAGPYKIGIFLYPDQSDRCVAYHLSTFSKGGLEPSYFHSGTATTHLRDLPQPVPPGDYQVGFLVDIENSVPETSETNNLKALGLVRL